MGRFLIIPILFLAFIQANVASAAVELIDNVDIKWTFQPAGHQEKYKLDFLGLAIIQQLPKSVPCCTGTYEATLLGKTLRELIAKDNLQFPALHFPAVNGLKTISITGRVILKRMNGDYGSSGPIVALTKEQLAEEKISITVEVDYPKLFFAGFWLNRLMLGEYDELQSRREGILIHQKYVPLFLTYFFSIIALLLIWLSYIKKDQDRNLYTFLEVTLLWAIFYFALSGELRRIFPYWGAYLHFMLRSLACLSTIRLVLTLSNRSKSEIRLATYSGLASILIGALLSWDGEQRWQQIGYLFVNIEFNLILFLIISGRITGIEKEGAYKFLIATGIILIIGSTIDAANLIGVFFFQHRVSFPFLARYLTPPFILFSIVYIAHRASMQADSENRRKLSEKFNEQLLHDLRSPAVAIRNVALSSTSPRQINSENEILTMASERIISMCRPQKKNTVSTKIINLNKTLHEVITEKRAEWGTIGELQIVGGDDPINVLTDESELKRVISNILNNSYEANLINPKIEVTLRASDRFGHISISDNCGGIPSSVLKKINSGEIKSTKITGRGIGLFNAKEFASRWDGKLSIQSESSEGTTIEISLPCVKNA